MSGILECEGVFEMHVPDGWSVTGVEGEWYEAVHELGDVVVNISVLVPEEGTPPRSAEELVVAFAETAESEAAELEVRVPDDGGHRRAFVRFPAKGHDWIAMAMTLNHDDVVVLASTDAPSDRPEALAQGELLVASIAPAPPTRRRRWFSRR